MGSLRFCFSRRFFAPFFGRFFVDFCNSSVAASILGVLPHRPRTLYFTYDSAHPHFAADRALQDFPAQGCSQNACVFDSFLEAKIVEKHVRNAFFTEYAENHVLGPLLDPKIEPTTPSGSIFRVPRGGPKLLENAKKWFQEASETRPFKKKMGSR